MTTTTKSIVALVLAVVIGGAIYGAYQYPTAQVSTSAGSSAGASFSNAKFYGVVMALANPGVNGTSTSILNTDSSDRYVTGVRIACNGVGSSKTAYTGAGLANLTLQIGTTSAANPVDLSSSFAKVTGAGMNIPTSTIVVGIASTTSVLATSSLAVEWPANTNLTFQFNATNTAACTVGVDSIGS